MQRPDEITIEKTLDSIETLGLLVTPADLATHTGAPVNQVRRRLNEVAARTGAVLEVASDGRVTYKFLPSFKNAYKLTGISAALQRTMLFLGQAGFFILRVSFGVMLMLSIAIIVLLFVAIIIAAIFGDSGGGNLDFGSGGGGGSSSGGGNWFDPGSLGDGFRWDYTSSHSRKISKYGVPKRTLRLKEQVKKGNFCLECFSFLFGDGDPNADIEDERWSSIAEVIRQNDCVVVEEQLAPFLDPGKDEEASILEVLYRFDGSPRVSDSGNIVYVFENMQSQKPNQKTSSPEPYLEEGRLEFSQYPQTALVTVLILATLNFAGSWWLFRHVAQINLLHHFVYLIDFLLAYGSMFLLIPLVRIFFNKIVNVGIDQRNEWRKKRAEALSLMNPDLQAKIDETRVFANELSSKTPGSICYTTERDILEQQFDKPE